VADRFATDAMIAQVIADFGQVDTLINNAGIGSSGVGRPTITGATPEQVDLLMGANLLSPMNICRTIVRHMRNAERSDVIMISSVATQSMGCASTLSPTDWWRRTWVSV